MTTAPNGRLRSGTWFVAFVMVLSACTLGVAENEAGSGRLFTDSLSLIPVQDREPAPVVCGPTTAGDDLCLADLAGRPTLVNFWASWCGPCAREIPELVALNAEYGDRIDVVGVDEEESLVNARSFERDQRVTYPSFTDGDAVIAGAFGGIAPSALPSTILLDAEHRVAIRLLGAVTAAQLQPYIDELIAET